MTSDKFGLPVRAKRQFAQMWYSPSAMAPNKGNLVMAYTQPNPNSSYTRRIGLWTKREMLADIYR